MNEEFSGYESEEEDASSAADIAGACMDLDVSVEDREEEILVREYFGSPCCSLGPKKGPCWTHAGKERFLHARQESLDLEKKELDLVVLANRRASFSLTRDSSASHEGTRASIKYQYGGSTFFQSFFKPIQNITSYYHFKMSKADPGIVTVKEYAHSPEIKVGIFKKDINQSSFRGQQPNKIVPTGLDSKHQWYLYDEIRPFCSNNLAKDMTCPKPSVPRPQTATQQKKQRKKT